MNASRLALICSWRQKSWHHLCIFLPAGLDLQRRTCLPSCSRYLDHANRCMTWAGAIERNSSSTCHQAAFVALPPFFLWGTPQARLARDCETDSKATIFHCRYSHSAANSTLSLNHPKQPHSAEVGTCQAEDEVEVQLSPLPESDEFLKRSPSVEGLVWKSPCLWKSHDNKMLPRTDPLFRSGSVLCKISIHKECFQLFDPDFSSLRTSHSKTTSLNFHQASLLHLDARPEDESICILYECSGPTWAESWKQLKFLQRLRFCWEKAQNCYDCSNQLVLKKNGNLFVSIPGLESWAVMHRSPQLAGMRNCWADLRSVHRAEQNRTDVKILRCGWLQSWPQNWAILRKPFECWWVAVFSQVMFLYLAFCFIALCCCLCVEIPGLFIQNRYIWPAWVWTQNKQGSRNTVHASQSFEKPHIVLNASKWPGVWLLDRHLPMKLCNQHHQWILQSSERHLLTPDFVDSIFHWQKAAIICDTFASTKWKGFVESSAPRGTLARVAYQPLQRWMANWKRLKTWSGGYSNIIVISYHFIGEVWPDSFHQTNRSGLSSPSPTNQWRKFGSFVCSYLSGCLKQMRRRNRLAGIKTVADVSPVALHLEKTNPNERE